MNAATHPIAPEEVMAFLDEELSAERAPLVSTHVNECLECRDVRATIEVTRQAFAKWIVPNVPPSLADDLAERPIDSTNVRAGGFVSDLRRLLSHRLALAWGGGILVVLLVFFGSLNRTNMTSPSYSAGSQQKMYEESAPPSAPAVTAGHRRREGLTLPLAEKGKNPIALEGRDETKTLYQGWIQQGPMIARIVSLSVVVKDFDAGRASLDAILARHNGYSASLSVSTPQGAARTLQASLRIPAPQLAGALSELKSLGRVEAETQNGEEVTQQHADLVARLKNARETEQRLQDVLRTRTGKVKDVLEVEEEIARVRGEVEQMEAEQKSLEHRVEFATIDLKLAEEYKAQLSTPAPSVAVQLRNATIDGFRNAFDSVLALALFFAESGPILLLWLALLGLPAWRLWRRYRRAQSLGSLAGA